MNVIDPGHDDVRLGEKLYHQAPTGESLKCGRKPGWTPPWIVTESKAPPRSAHSKIRISFPNFLIDSRSSNDFPGNPPKVTPLNKEHSSDNLVEFREVSFAVNG